MILTKNGILKEQIHRILVSSKKKLEMRLKN